MKDRKTEQLVVRLTERERALIEAFAAQNGMKTSKAARRLFEAGLNAATSSEGSARLISTPAGAALPIAQP